MVTTIYIIVGIVFVASLISVPFIKKYAMTKAAELSKELDPYATENGFFVRYLGNNVKFKFNNIGEDDFTKHRMGISTFTVVPQGPTSILITRGAVQYEDWKYEIEGLTIEALDVKPGFVYSILLLSKKNAQEFFKNPHNGKSVYQHYLKDIANVDEVSLYITENYYK